MPLTLERAAWRRASDKCQREKRKTINGDDLLWAMKTLGFDAYEEPLRGACVVSLTGDTCPPRPAPDLRARCFICGTSLLAEVQRRACRSCLAPSRVSPRADTASFSPTFFPPPPLSQPRTRCATSAVCDCASCEHSLTRCAMCQTGRADHRHRCGESNTGATGPAAAGVPMTDSMVSGCV